MYYTLVECVCPLFTFMWYARVLTNEMLFVSSFRRRILTCIEIYSVFPSKMRPRKEETMTAVQLVVSNVCTHSSPVFTFMWYARVLTNENAVCFYIRELHFDVH
jgi:hypothetical protein